MEFFIINNGIFLQYLLRKLFSFGGGTKVYKKFESHNVTAEMISLPLMYKISLKDHLSLWVELPEHFLKFSNRLQE